MSGDSPSSHVTETIFDFKEGRHSPIPTTSKEPTPPRNIVTASVLVEPPKKEEEKEQESCPFGSPVANNGDDVKADRGDEEPPKLDDSGGREDRKDELRKHNGADALDGKWVPPLDAKSDKDDEECAVKCLYYTMQCCECTIL